MTLREEGEVYFSARANQFYQKGRRGAVSRERGIEFARYDRETGQTYDMRGNVIPESAQAGVLRQDRKFFGRGRYGESILTGEWLAVKVGQRDAETRRLGSNERIVIKTTIRTPDGKTHTETIATGKGENYDPEFHGPLADRKASANLRDLGYSINTNEVREATVRREYYKETLKSFRKIKR